MITSAIPKKFKYLSSGCTAISVTLNNEGLTRTIQGASKRALQP
jgi:hypothetical protein